MSPFRIAAAAALLAQIPVLAAAALGHADPATLEAAGRAAMVAAGAAVASPPGWPSLPGLLAGWLAHLVPAVWAVLVPATLAAALAAGIATQILQVLGARRPALWGFFVGLSPALLAAPGLGWTLLAGILPMRALACFGRPGAGVLSLYGFSLALAPFLSPAILPALPLLVAAGWTATHGPMRRETPVATAFLVAFPLLMTIVGIAYTSWALGGSGTKALARLIPALPLQAPGLVPAALLAAVCLPLLLWPMRTRYRLSRAARLAALGLALAAALGPTLNLADLWMIPALVLPGALLLAGLSDTPLPVRRAGLVAALAGGLAPALLVPPPALAPLERALAGATPADAPWRAAIAAAPTLLEPADAALAAFAPPGRVLAPGSEPFRAAEARRWEAPQAIIRNPRRTASRLGHANPALAIGAPEGYEIAIDDGRRRLLRRIDS